MARKRNYLNNRDLLEEIILSKEKDELTPKALEFLMLLADKFIDIGGILIQQRVLMHLLILLK